MNGRKLNAVELKIHQAALSAPKKTLSAKELEAVVPDGSARTAALNFLSGTGMLKVMTHPSGAISFRAVLKKEMEVKKDMSGEEAMVLSHIQAGGNLGIWTKHLKAKTELHQTVIDRILKSLVQKQLIKPQKDVRHLTRKIYMLEGLTPSDEMTGGPWYTEAELDTEFIKLLCSACLHYVKDRSFPKQKSSESSQALYSISASPSYPTARHVQNFLSKSKITETELTVEHVEMLLNVLILDGEIEKIPAFGAAIWDATALEEDNDSESDGQNWKGKGKRKANKSSPRKNRKTSANLDDSSDEREHKRSTKRRHRDTNDGDQKGKKRKANESGDDSSDNERVSKKKRRKVAMHNSDTETDSSPRRRPSSSRKRSSSPAPHLGEENFTSAYVYRAIRQERVALGLSQAPCGKCPVFEFCKDKGPVNPRECNYFEGWLESGVAGLV